MKKSCVQHFDAAGHRILDHAAMLLYYQSDSESLNIVRSHMPHRYICLPTVEIRISTQDMTAILVYLIYPGKTEEKTVVLSERGLNGLRKAWAKNKRWSRRKIGNNTLVMRLEGRVILDPKKRFGVWSPNK